MNFGNKINWIFIFTCILENTLVKVFDLPMPGIRLMMMFAAIAVNLSNTQFQKAFTKGAVGIWGVWTIYSLINWYICPHSPLPYKDYVYIGGYVKTYVLLAILYYEASLNYRRTLKLLLWLFVCYFFIGTLGQGNGPVKESSSWKGRSGTLLGNHFPLAMVCGLFVTFIAKMQGLIKMKYLYVAIVCVVGVVLWVATRKAMYGIFILCFFYVLSNIDLKQKSNIVYLAIGTGAIYLAYKLIMRYTLLGARVDQLDEFEYSVEVPVHLQFLGDRAIQYVLAWDVFLEHPINGVGLGNSMDYTGLSIPLHTEYMEHLCEGGIIGAGLFVRYIYSIVCDIITTYKNESDKSNSIIMAGGFAMLLFVALTSWLYNIPHFFVVYAMIIAYCQPLVHEKNI